MPVYGASRYRGVKFTTTQMLDGSRKTFLHSRKFVSKDDIKTPLNVRYIRNEDMIDLVAHLHGKDERKWWLVADINDILFPLEMGTGDIYVPDRSEFNKIGR